MKHSKIARPLCYLLSALVAGGYLSAVLIAWASIFLTISTGAARAQEVSRPSIWAVLDFSNQTGYGGADIGREAADALVVELSASNRFDVLQRSEVGEGLDALGLTPPLDAVDIQKLGRQISADAIVSGDVLSITRLENPHRIQAVIAVRATDTSSGELVNGALAEGVSAPRGAATADDDTLVNEAIQKAAFAAVKQISGNNLPVATVLNNEGPDTLLINKGSRDGMTSGLNMLVLRNGQEVGRIRVASVGSDESTAVITDEGIGIRPEDRARAIYALPSYSVHDGRVATNADLSTGEAVVPAAKNSFSGVGGILLALLSAAVLVGLVNRGSSDYSIGGASVSGATAQAGYGQAIGLPYPVGGNAPASEGAGVRIKWGTGNINPSYIVCFNIYRDDFSPAILGGVGGVQQSSTTTSSTTSSTTTGSTTSTTTGGATTTTTTGNSVDIEVANEGPVLSVGPQLRSAIDDSNSRVVGYFTFAAAGLAVNGNTVPAGALLFATNSVPVPGVEVGVHHPYQVTATYAIPTIFSSTTATLTATSSASITTTTGGTLPQFQETPVSAGSTIGVATPVIPIDVTAATTTINGAPAYNQTGVTFSSVTLSFTSTLGADTYIADFSTSPYFRPKFTTPIQVTTTNGGQQISFTNLILTSLVQTYEHQHGGNPPPGIYFRIGSRYGLDNPGPTTSPLVTPNPDAGANGGSYIYGLTGEFTGS